MSSQTVSFPAADALVENDGAGDSPSPAAPERTSSEKASSSGKAPRPYPLARVNSTPVSLPQYRGARAMHDDFKRQTREYSEDGDVHAQIEKDIASHKAHAAPDP